MYLKIENVRECGITNEGVSYTHVIDVYGNLIDVFHGDFIITIQGGMQIPVTKEYFEDYLVDKKGKYEYQTHALKLNTEVK